MILCGLGVLYAYTYPAMETQQYEITWDVNDYEERKPAAEWVIVDINEAGAEELMKLPGIGEAKALAVIAYRESEGPFASAEEIMKVSGIKQGVFDKIREHIYVNGG